MKFFLQIHERICYKEGGQNGRSLNSLDVILHVAGDEQIGRTLPQDLSNAIASLTPAWQLKATWQ